MDDLQLETTLTANAAPLNAALQASSRGVQEFSAEAIAASKAQAVATTGNTAAINALTEAHPTALRHEVRFPPAREGHRMVGSGMFIINPPYGIESETEFLTNRFKELR